MTETKLISIRVPVELLQEIDKLAESYKPITRSGVIVNFLQALMDAADGGTRYLAVTWPLRKKKGYVITSRFNLDAPDASTLSSSNLITP